MFLMVEFDFYNLIDLKILSLNPEKLGKKISYK